MSTNYYVQVGEVCKCCGCGGEVKHIGTSSIGWCFALHVYPEEGINSLTDWIKILVDKTIEDEYGKPLLLEEFLNRVVCRKGTIEWDKPMIPYNNYRSWEEFHEKNHSQRGPYGLIRHQIDGSNCIGHGPGTYDYLIGDFS